MWCMDVDISGYAGPLKRPMLSCVLKDFYLIQDYEESLVNARVDRILDRLNTAENVAGVRLDCSPKRSVLHVRRLGGAEETMTISGLGCPLRTPAPSR
jgi:hypothetical protein